MEVLALIFRIVMINISIMIETYLAFKIVFLFRYKQPDSKMQSKRNTQYFKILIFSIIFHLLSILPFILMFGDEVSSFEKIILVFVPLVMVSTIFSLWIFRYVFIYKKTKDDTNRLDLWGLSFLRSDVFTAVFSCLIIYYVFDQYRALFSFSALVGSCFILSLVFSCFRIYHYVQKKDKSY